MSRFFSVFIAGFLIYYWVDVSFFSFLQKEVTLITGSKATGHILAYFITLIPLLLTVSILSRGYKNAINALGLSGKLIHGFGFAFLVTLPMLIAYAMRFNLNRDLSPDTVFINTVSSAFFEEIIYRSFLFGMLYRFTRLGFLLSVFVGSLLFGIAHLYQSTDISQATGIFLVTFLGSVLFSWIYIEWKLNIWAAVFLHCLMNLYWLIFNVDTTAMGDLYANFFRFLSILLAIAITVLFKKKRRYSLEINRKTWWLKPENS